MSFGQNISDLIGKAGFTKTEICRKAKISRPALDSWINEETYPKVDILFNLASVLKCSIHDFFDKDDKIENSLDQAFENWKTELKTYINSKLK